MQSITTRRALLDIRPHLRPFVLTRSSFPGTGAYAAHWTGDNWSNWEHLADSISSIFNFQLFGIPLVGADICGFLGNATEELCVRWHQLGAFYPFARNHNAIGQSDQEPYKWPAVADALRTALDIRLALLSYMYTLFYDAHARGDTVWRPLFFEFPMDEGAYHFDHQIMIGDTIMITPVLEPGQDMLEVYFPGAVWFDWYTSMPILIGPKAHREDDSRLRRDSIGDTVTVYAPLDRIPIFIRGGRAIALHTSQSTTAATHSTPFTLLVALDEQGLAHGKLYLDDGVSQHLHDGWSDILFKMDIYARQLNVSGYFGYASAKPIQQLKILTASSSLMRTMVSTNQVDMHRALSRLQLRVNGTSIETSSIQLNKAGTELTIDGLDLPLTAPFVIEW
jgi:alpha-glucosidase (family GH31 glycosyl hydrolase)